MVRLELNGEKVTKEERLLGALNERIRDVRNGPDGALWLLTDSSAGRILRVTPANKEHFQAKWTPVRRPEMRQTKAAALPIKAVRRK